MNGDSTDTRLGRIEGKMDLLTEVVERQFPAINTRLISLERSRGWITGAVGVVAAGLGWAWKQLGG